MHPIPTRLGTQAPALLALAAGGATVLGFAPFSFYPVPILACALLCGALVIGCAGYARAARPAAWGFLTGYAFGVGLLGLGVAWVRISLNEFGNMGAWLADLLTGLFVAAMALYYGLLGSLVRRFGVARPVWVGPLLLFPGLYVLLEWLRGWLFTGFPWLSLGYTQIDGPLAGYAPIAGVYGISLLVALSGGLLSGLLRFGWLGRAIALASLAVVWLGGLGLQRIDWTWPAGEPFSATVIQANIPQATKWDPKTFEETLETYLRLTKKNIGSDLIVWPETAIPAFLHEVRGGFIDRLAEDARAEDAEIVLGIPVMNLSTGRYSNGLLSIGVREDLYAKRHLVPFGEFLPFKPWLGPLVKAFEIPMADFIPGDSKQPLLHAGSYEAGASICYEDVFPAETIQALPRARYLINVSNDAWFGDSLAPHQHLEMARMRAIETGRYMVRATNTGISAIVDHRGQVTGHIPSFVRATHTGSVEPRAGSTPFVRVGNWLPIGLAAAMTIAGLLIRHRPRGTADD